jgi:hypothetical protein
MSVQQLLTEDEVAKLICVSPRTLRGLRAQGMIRYIRPSPRKVLYSADDCVDFINRQARQEEPTCPSINLPKAVSGISISGSNIVAFTDLRAAHRSGTRKDTKPISGGERR